MALPIHVRDRLARIRKSRSVLQESFADGSKEFREVIERARVDDELAEMYVVKILEASPVLGKVRARRVLQEIKVCPTTPLRSIDDATIALIDEQFEAHV